VAYAVKAEFANTVPDNSLGSEKLATDPNSISKITGGQFSVAAAKPTILDDLLVTNTGGTTTLCLQDANYWLKAPVSNALEIHSLNDLVFSTNASPTERVRILGVNGYVGIGTASPVAPLHINHAGGITLTNNIATMTIKPDVSVSVLMPAPAAFSTVAAQITNRHFGHLVFDILANDIHDSFAIRTDNDIDGVVDTVAFVVKPNGAVGIGTITPAYKLDVQGGPIRVQGTVYTSDARYKTNIATFDNALNTILNLRGVAFDWKRNDFKEMEFTEGRQIGFIAQEVEKVLPELVTTDSNHYKSVAYANVVPVLVEAMKQQHKQFETVKAENARLQEQLAALTEAVQELQTRGK
jgi:hypothetical protein